ncbi:UDP-N-acetylmuramoyl-L-alanyl-D-glutamate--2,6-diaminopimelate ligase [Micrococcus sp.]|uniref:Mur ligase family protein n=1 Tax=Micrococcus sp. TaxID=1271 RepID=UPI002A912020|nr:UDP-N-acetylmuramoyl-L-alanyl-D-glutamate--2,6-diaminopimelate ligase [Micrococcus sp.]MDY6055567.1 UDP-N-acetylmuramoyl-L-alanyl-D-glutamate--2,6-diaminopimelate ligase [Micrococcus sp.]
MTDAAEPTPALTPREQDRAFRPAHVEPVAWSELVAALTAAGRPVHVHGPEGPAVTGVALDSRVVGAGDLYLALPGARAHGAAFAAAALEAGAAGILTDAEGVELLRRGPQVPVLEVDSVRDAAGAVASRVYGGGFDAGPRLIGVTGTNGKTTTSFLAASLIEALGRSSGIVGTILTRAGDRTVPSTLTTPESTQLHALMALMREEGVDTAVMEVSSHAVEYRRIAGLRYAAAGFTNLTQDHLDLHGSMEAYAEAKAGLFDAGRTAHAVVVLDGGEGPRWGVAMAESAQAPTTTLALGPAGPHPGSLEREAPQARVDWEVTDLLPDGLGHRFILRHRASGRTLPASVGLPGRFNVANAALAALLVLEALGEEHLDALREVLDVPAGQGPFAAAVPGRMEVVGREPDAVVDFAHNPDGMVQALRSLADARTAAGRAGRTLIVFGAAGDRDATKRPVMGRIAAEHADVVIVTDDTPHSEAPAPIRAQVLAGAREEAERAAATGRTVLVEEVGDRAEAIRRAVELAGPEDGILVAGRGHETAMDYDGVAVPLDDRVALREALAAAGRLMPTGAEGKVDES